MEIYKDITFEAAHLLPNLPDGHKCSRLHGHSFKLRISVDGDIDKKVGWVKDFSDIKEVFDPIIYEKVFSRIIDNITPNDYLEYAKSWLKNGAQIVGGCCGVGVEEIKAISVLKN